MPEEIECQFYGGQLCTVPYTECPLPTQPRECPKMPEGEEEEREGDPPGGPG